MFRLLGIPGWAAPKSDPGRSGRHGTVFAVRAQLLLCLLTCTTLARSETQADASPGTPAPQSSSVVTQPAPAAGQVAVAQVNDDKAAARDLRARQLYSLGDRLYAEGNYEAAVTSFEAAYELSQRVPLLFNIANALERLGRYEEARRRLEDYAPHAPASQREAVMKRIVSLEVRARRQRQEILARVERELAKTKPPAPPPLPIVFPEKETGPTDSTPFLGYSLLGVGAIGFSLGAVLASRASADRSDAQELCAARSGRTLCPSTARGVLDSETSNAALADVSLAVGILAAASGAYLIFRDDAGEELVRARTFPAQAGWRVDLVTKF